MESELSGVKEEDDQEDGDEIFDFGKAKMDYFKQRAREILIDKPVHGGRYD